MRHDTLSDLLDEYRYTTVAADLAGPPLIVVTVLAAVLGTASVAAVAFATFFLACILGARPLFEGRPAPQAWTVVALD